MTFKIKILLKSFFYYIVDFFVVQNKKILPKSILLVRLDTIGDYILFRNFIEILKKSEKYKDYQITFVGNMVWKELAEEFDTEFIQHFVWIDRKKFSKKLIYRFKKLREITSIGYEVIISPRYSREFYFEDAIVKLVNAKEKIGSEGDLSNIKALQKKISDNYYTRLIPALEDIMFEFYRNKKFIEYLLEEKINIKKPVISIPHDVNKYHLPSEYAVLFIGASADYRKWNIIKFAETGKYLKNKYGLKIVICGSKNEIKDVIKFSEYFGELFINLVGKTSLIDLLHIIGDAKLIISNETVTPHLAVAVGKPKIIVISNGNHFGRFTPYPKEMTNTYHVIYHPEIENDLNNYKKLSNQYGYGSKLNINEVDTNGVKKIIDNILMDSY